MYAKLRPTAIKPKIRPSDLRAIETPAREFNMSTTRVNKPSDYSLKEYGMSGDEYIHCIRCGKSWQDCCHISKVEKWKKSKIAEAQSDHEEKCRREGRFFRKRELIGWQRSFTDRPGQIRWKPLFKEERQLPT
jgi:hypothetical protein